MKDGDKALIKDLVWALEAVLEWVDAVPSDTALPTMPGVDRDEVEIILERAKDGK